MAKPRAIIKRRNAIRNIRKITRTMELIATARFKRAMDRATEAEAYTQKITELVKDLSAGASDLTHPLLEIHEKIENAVLLAMCSNRGLCGGYNANVLRATNQRYERLRERLQVRLEVSGKRGISFFRYRRIKPDEVFTHLGDRPRFDEVEVIADRYLDWYTSGRIDRLDVAYTRFLSAGRQVATVETLLPLHGLDSDRDVSGGNGSTRPKRTPAAALPHAMAAVQYEFLPEPADILAELLPVSFKVRLFKCFLDAAVSEQIARMVAMKGATENADTLIRTLTMQYNRARQAQITKEISEIIGGAEALK